MFVKEKSVFMVVLLVLSIFYVSFFNVEDVNATQEVLCCERASDGAWCVDTYDRPDLECSIEMDPVSNSVYRFTPTSCDNSGFCDLGCCIEESTGKCDMFTYERACVGGGLDFDKNDDSCSASPVCDKGCCVLGTSYSWKTEKECILDFVGTGMEYEEDSWRHDIENERECISLVTDFEKGCCKKGEGLFKENYGYSLKGDCDGDDEIFYEGQSCGEVSPAICGTSSPIKKCGDPYRQHIENIYEYDLCNSPIRDTPCAFPSSTICDDSSGVARCIPIDCVARIIPNFKGLNDEDLVPWDNNDEDLVPGGNKNIMHYLDEYRQGKFNEESWCIYEGSIGEGYDLVGSRHYVGSCKYGKFELDSCDERRGTICVQDSEDSPTKAKCRLNLATFCMGCNEHSDSKLCCEGIQPDCSWISYEYSGKEKLGICIPNYVIGTYGSKQESVEEEPSEGFSFNCKEIWKYYPLTNKRECKKNCFCHKEDYAEKINEICQKLGDYGFKYNLKGDSGLGGEFNITGSSHAPSITKKSFDFVNTVSKGIHSDMIPDQAVLEKLITEGYIPMPKSFDLNNPWYSDPTFLASIFGIAIALAWVPGVNIVVFAIAILVAAFVGIATVFSGREYARNLYYECAPWIAPTGGEYCEKCDTEDGRVCDEYKCLSLGRGCTFDVGTRKCTHFDSGDASPATIKPPVDNNQNYEGYKIEYLYRNEFIVGYEIKNTESADGEILYYETFSLGLKTEDNCNQDDCDDRTVCKIDNVDIRTDESFEDYGFYFKPLLNDEHSVEISYNHAYVAGWEDEDTPIMESSEFHFDPGENRYYVYCEDINGNVNEVPFIIEFDVAEVPNLIAPELSEFSLEGGTYIKYGAGTTDLTFKVNQLVEECRYSNNEGEIFDVMEGEVTCDNDVNTCGVGGSWTEEGLFIQDEQSNKFYFKCKTKFEYNDGEQDLIVYRENTQDSPCNNPTSCTDVGLNLIGTKELEISDINIEENEILENKEVRLELRTSEGAENGKSTCYYGLSENINQYNGIPFFNTGDNVHIQEGLFLSNGPYIYHFLCVDEAGNEVREEREFTVQTPELVIEEDETKPHGTIYEDTFDLTVVTSGGVDQNGNSQCSYSVTNGERGSMDHEESSGSTTTHTKESIDVGGLANAIVTIRCVDTESKSATQIIILPVSIGIRPHLSQVYTIGISLNIIMDEPLIECKYDVESFDYRENENMMNKESEYRYSLSINSPLYYVICNHSRTFVLSPEYEIII